MSDKPFNLDDLSDEQLQAILDTRRNEREAKLLKDHQLYVDTLKNIGHCALPLMKHGRTSCNEQFNGAFHDRNYNDSAPACTKCGLQAIIDGDEDLPLGMRLEFQFVTR